MDSSIKNFKKYLFELDFPKKDNEQTKKYKRRKEGFSYIVNDYYSREERHYCAVLYSWLLQDITNVNDFLKSFSPKLLDEEVAGYNQVRLYYEFTWLRDIIYEFSRYAWLTGEKPKLKKELEEYIFKERRDKEKEIAKVKNRDPKDVGDIQKKKPDLAIYLKNTKKLILIEAKFEEGFEIKQIEETARYGIALKQLLGESIIKETTVALLGREDFLDKIKTKIRARRKDKEKPKLSFNPLISCLSWECLEKKFSKNDFIGKEIEKGLKNQKRIHPNT